jgi:hypothetical protein
MTLPGWSVEGATHRHAGYTIEPAPGHLPGWVVHAPREAHPVLTDLDGAHFSSLKAARSAAIHHHMRVVRRTKMLRHGTLAAVGVAVVIPAFVMLTPGQSTARVGWFVVGLAVLLLTLREVIALVMLLISDGWDYAYDAPACSRLDRAVADLATAVARVPTRVDAENDRAAVHVIDADEHADGGRNDRHGGTITTTRT